MSNENWKISKSIISYSGTDGELIKESQKAQEEYSSVAQWCNESQKYHIEDTGDYYEVVKNPEPTEDELKELVRNIRNRYLEIYVDPVVSNPLRWSEMTESARQQYINYRRYLLDYTGQSDWWLKAPLAFDEWKSL